jgi:hypothetical protein
MVSATFAFQSEGVEGVAACMIKAPDKRLNERLRTARYLRM